MKKLSMILTALILSTGLFLVCASFVAPPPGPSANGQGSLIYGGQAQHFAFHAKTQNGVTTGSWESKSPGQNVRTHGTIDCLTIMPDGKTAYMTGVVTKKVGDGFPPGAYEVGSPIWFKVVDNGEGNTSATDQFTDYYNFGNCVDRPNRPLQDILNGNIQVKP